MVYTDLALIPGYTTIKSVSMRKPGRTRQGVIMLKSRISLKLGTIDGCGEILISTKNKVAILNSLGFTCLQSVQLDLAII